MLTHAKTRLTAAGVLAAALAAISVPVAAQCVDYSNDLAGCQPSTFKTPLGEMPTVRINRDGQADPTASEADVRAGAARLEEKLHLVRNFEHLHWVPLVPSVKDPATGAWKGGDLDGAGTGRSFAISGNCIFAGHNSLPGVTLAMNILQIQADPEKQPPVHVGEIPTPRKDGKSITSDFDPRRGIDDKEARALTYEISPGEGRMILVRLTGDLVEWHRIDINTCRPIAKSETYDMAGGPHEFFLWHDPANRKRVLVYMAMFGGGSPDPEHPLLRVPDVVVFAVTDEDTGEILSKPRVLAGFSLQEVGGPPISEKPDATGLFADGRFADFSQVSGPGGTRGDFRTSQSNAAHSVSVSDDGERAYVAASTAGFYILNSESIARRRDADLVAGTAGCNQRSTIVSVDGLLDPSKVPQVANDCLHMVVNDDPGLKAFLASSASGQAKAQRYLVLLTRSRFDVHPPINATGNGIHSAVVVPNRPAQVNGNTKNRPAYVFLTDETLGGCPSTYARIVSIEVETTPVMVGAYATPDEPLEECLNVPTTEPGGQPRPRQLQHSHNPTVFKNLVFLGYLVNGMRVIDISRPQMPREVGHALTVPSANRQGSARGYAVFKDGLMYWVDNGNGLHVAKYTGPRSNELPGPGSGVYDGNSTSPHR